MKCFHPVEDDGGGRVHIEALGQSVSFRAIQGLLAQALSALDASAHICAGIARRVSCKRRVLDLEAPTVGREHVDT